MVTVLCIRPSEAHCVAGKPLTVCTSAALSVAEVKNHMELSGFIFRMPEKTGRVLFFFLFVRVVMNLKCSAIRNVVKHADFLCWFVSHPCCQITGSRDGHGAVCHHIWIFWQRTNGALLPSATDTHTHTLRGNHV